MTAPIIVLNSVPFDDLTKAREFADWLELNGIEVRDDTPLVTAEQPKAERLEDRTPLEVRGPAVRLRVEEVGPNTEGTE